MNEQAIKKLRNKFIAMQTLTLVTVMFLMSGLIYLFNVWISSNNIRDTIEFIMSNNGMIQDAEIIFDSSLGIDNTDNSEFSQRDEAYNIAVFLKEIFGIKQH